MNYEHFIAKRIAFKKDSSFTKTIIRIAIASTALSIIVMILASAVLDGFSREIHAKVFGFWGNIHITNTNITRNFDLKPISIDEPYYEEIKLISSVEYQEIDDNNEVNETGVFKSTNGGIKHIQPFIIMPGLIETSDAFQAILYKGIDDEYDWENMNQYLVDGGPINYDSLDGGVIISKSIANKLKLTTGKNIIISFIQNRQKLKRRVEVKGIYNTGLEEYDKRFILGRMGVVQQILNWNEDEVSGIEVFVENTADTKIMSEYLYENIIPLDMYCETIEDKFPNIFEWLKLQDINELVIYQLMIIVALINMITVILILVLERSKMIGILKSLGASNSSIKKIFLLNAAYILGWGILVGNVVGITLALLQKYFGFIKLDEVNYYLDTAPIHIDWINVLLINLGSIGIILLALLLPLIIISTITPIKTLRFN